MLNLFGCIRFNVKFVFWGFDVNCKFFVCDFKMGRNKGMDFIYGGISFDVRVFFSQFGCYDLGFYYFKWFYCIIWKGQFYFCWIVLCSCGEGKWCISNLLKKRCII